LRCKVNGRQNLPKRSSCIIVANHVNLLDSPLLGVKLGRRVYFMAKDELFQNRVIGWLAYQFGAFPVTKGILNKRAGRRAQWLLKNGQALIIYPEGRRSPDGKLGPAYSGAVLLAIKQGVPIVPVGIIGTSQLKGKWWFLRRPKIAFNIGEPFALNCSAEKPTKEEITRLTNDVMLQIAELLPADYRGSYVK
jgi:1-acyl-sn-glycerol-3-phosphate acyltransferase